MAAKSKKKTKQEVTESKRGSLAERLQGLDALFEAMSKESGIVAGRPTKSQAVMNRMTFKFFKTPIPAFNEATGGIPVGKMVLIAGNPNSGKTGFCLSAIGYQMQIDPDFIALWVESEDSLDVRQAESLYHIDLDRFFCISTRDPITKKEVFGAEAVGNALVKTIRDMDIDICVINSLKMLVPMQEARKNLEEDTMAVQARYNSKLLRKLIPLCAQRETSMVIVEHYAQNLNAGMYGNPNSISGGKSIRYNNMVTLEFSSLSPDDGDPITKETGMKIKVRVTKNHCVTDRNPLVDFTYFIEYGFGIEKYYTTLQQLIKRGIIDTRGAWLNLHVEDGQEVDPNFKWQGKARFKEDMIANPTKFDTLVSMLDGVTGDVSTLSAEEIAEIEAEEQTIESEMEAAGIEKVDADVKEADAA